MKPVPGKFEHHEQIIAVLLWYGTWFASAIIAAGIVLGAFPQWTALNFSIGSHVIVKTGIAIFILLPVARVVLMLAIFWRERDYLYVAISALVLVIIATGLLLGRSEGGSVGRHVQGDAKMSAMLMSRQQHEHAERE